MRHIGDGLLDVITSNNSSCFWTATLVYQQILLSSTLDIHLLLGEETTFLFFSLIIFISCYLLALMVLFFA